MKCPECAGPAPAAAVARRRVRAGTILIVGALLIAASAAIALSRLGGSPEVATVTPVGSWQSVADLTAVRGGTTAELLPDGRVLTAGGGIGSLPIAATELFDPASGSWTRVGDLHDARRGNATALLRDGRVFTTGGVGANGRPLASAEIYDSASQRWTAVAPMHEPRLEHTLTALRDGRVLAAGGLGGDPGRPLASAEIFDPAAGSWTEIGPMADARSNAAAAPLRDGRVLIAGGIGGHGTSPADLRTTEVFDPSVTIITRAADMHDAREGLSLTVLPDGRVLASGGSSRSTTLAGAELYDPASGGWTRTGSMVGARRLHAASVLPDGKVLVTGGESLGGASIVTLATAEVFDPGTGTWRAAARMRCPRSSQAQVTLAGSGRVLVVGGDEVDPAVPPRAQSCAELYSESAGQPPEASSSR